MSNLQNQNALWHDRFSKQIATQHDLILFKSIQLPQLRLNWRTIIRSAAKRGKADPHCAVAERTKLPIVKIYGMTPSWFHDPGATEYLYNSKPTPPHGFATISSGFGVINGKEFPLILGVSRWDERGKVKQYVLPNHAEYSKLRHEAERFFPSISEAKDAGYQKSYGK